MNLTKLNEKKNCWGGLRPPRPPPFFSARIGRPADRSIGRPAGSAKISKKSHFGVFLAKKSYKIVFLGYFWPKMPIKSHF